MRNKNWLRYGLASTIVACGALSAVLIACGDDDSGVTANQPDGSTDGNNQTDTGGGGDTGTTDGGDSGPKVNPAKIILVHAATDYGPGNPLGMVRVCYATKLPTEQDFGLSPLVPLPHSVSPGSTLPFPGIPIGTGGPFPSTGLPLEGIAIRPYIISAQALAQRGITGNTGAAATLRCNSLLKSGFVPDGGFPGDAGATALEANKDYWQLADIPAGTFKNEKTYILSVTGCTADTNPVTFANKCGPDTANPNAAYVPPNTPGAGNLKVAVLELDANATVAADEMGVQLVHLSPQYQYLRTATGGAVVRPYQPVFGPDIRSIPDASYDANATVRVLQDTDAAAEMTFNAAATTATPVAKLKGIITTTGFYAAHPDDPASAGPFIPIPLNNAGILDAGAGVVTIQYLSNEANPYANGKVYTFVLVGDPQGPDGSPRKIHFLAFPNQFTPPSAN